MNNLVKILACLAGSTWLAIYNADCELGYIIGAWVWGVISLLVFAILIVYIIDVIKSR
jgi:hypothetical protein